MSLFRTICALGFCLALSGCGEPADTAPEPGIHGNVGIGFVFGQGVVTNSDLEVVLTAP